MDKLRFMRLWDLYGGLLTPTRQDITNLYFNLDLTVSEIADQRGISRQGVSECLNLCKKELEEFEQKLGHDKLLKEGELVLSLKLTDAARWADNFLAEHPVYAEDIAALKAILAGDYGDKVAAALEGKGN